MTAFFKPAESRQAELAASFATAVWTALSLTAIVLLSRRLSGAFERYPHGVVTVLLAGLGFGASWISSLSMARSRRLQSPHASGWAIAVLSVVTLSPPLVIGLSLTPSDGTATHMALLTLTVIAAVVTALSRGAIWEAASGKAASREGEAPAEPQAAKTHEFKDTASPQSANVDPVQILATEDADPHSHWMQRSPSDDGTHELLEGVVTVSFAVGQKLAVGHVSFCPLLSAVPEVDCEPADGCDVRWKVAVRQPYGLRIDVRRTDVDEPSDVPIAWFATAPVRRAHAA